MNIKELQSGNITSAFELNQDSVYSAKNKNTNSRSGNRPSKKYTKTIVDPKARKRKKRPFCILEIIGRKIKLPDWSAGRIDKSLRKINIFGCKKFEKNMMEMKPKIKVKLFCNG